MTTRIETINAAIEAVRKAERITKAKLIELSRDILIYLYIDEVNGTKGSGDVTPINRLLRVLTPMNQKMCVHFFKHFVAWRFDDELLEFTTKNKKQFEGKLELVTEFLEDENNNVYTWANDNLKVETKEIDYLAKLKKDMIKAFEQGITVDQVMNLLDEVQKDQEPVKEAA